MKHLILLRHGEAGFSGSLDFQRELTTKGKENLNRLGQTQSVAGMKLDYLYCSSAARASETAEIMKKYLAVGVEEYTREIYEGNLESLLNLLENTPPEAQSCILVGHNPTISVLIAHLTHGSYVGLQPGMMAILELDITDWSKIGLGTGTLKEVLR